jgi:ADP-ribose diphosphatase
MTDENKRRLLAEGKYVRLVARGRWEWVERTNTSMAVVIAAVTSDGELVLIDEYRHPLDARVVGLPAGLVGDEPGTGEEDLIEAAKRELLEEAGCIAQRWQYLIEGPSSPGLTNECYTMYLALDAKKSHPGGGDESEDIHVCLVPLNQVETWLQERLKKGLLVDPKVYTALYFAKK